MQAKNQTNLKKKNETNKRSSLYSGYAALLLLLLPLYFYGQEPKESLTDAGLNKIAEDYVRLGLAIGQYDGDFVDAYYGPDSLKPVGEKQSSFPKEHFLRAVNNLQARLTPYINKTDEDILSKRAKWINSQLIAFSRRIKMFSGEHTSFNQQAKELFAAVPPTYNEVYFRSLIAQLDHLLPGKGAVNARFQALANRFIIPKEKLDTIIKATIAESAKRTRQHYALPENEDFRLEYVTGKPWSGYNWYQGKYKSLIQFNTDITTQVERVIDIASHEGYPGHHVYNSLLEKYLYNDKGWIEISLYPLFSPQSLIAEGSANYGIEVAFPGHEKIGFAKECLLPLAGLDTSGLTAYLQALAIKGKLQHVRTEVTRRVIDGKMTGSEAMRWLMEYGLFNEQDAARSLSFSKKYQSYVINYTYGMDLVKHFIESKVNDEKDISKKWEAFKWVLTNELTAADLIQ